MKKLLFITLIGLSVISRAQTPKLTGIGAFQVGEKIENIISKVVQSNGRVKNGKNVVDYEYFYSEETPQIMEVYFDSSSILSFETCHGYPGERDFIINKYTVAGIEIERIELVFVDSVLVSFKCNASNELKEAINLKYGQGVVENKLDSVKCRFTYTGNEIYKQTLSETETWKSASVYALRYKSIYYDDKCKIGMFHVLVIQNKAVMEKLTQYKSQQRKLREEKDRVEKKNKLNDF